MEIIMWICPKCGNIKMGFPDDKCCQCGTPVIDTGLTWDEYAYEMTNVQEQEWEKQMKEKYFTHSKLRDEKAVQKRSDNEYKKSQQALKNIPKCPTCGSTNIRNIGGLERSASVFALGLFSKKINKSFKCNNCGYTW